MEPVDQTRFGYPEGNCVVACVASILEVALDELPDLHDVYHEEGRNWWKALRAGVRRHGWEAMYLGETYLDGVDPRELAPQGYAVAGGDSPREETVDEDGENAGHAVVALDGELVHDPHPSDDFLGGPVEDWILLIPPRDEEGDRA